MLNRFEQFCSSVSVIYKSIQKIKRDEMARYGLKGPHAQCLIAMNRICEDATLGRLCEICGLDKAEVSRVVAELEEKGLLERRNREDKSYRATLHLTDEGRSIAGHVSGIAERAVEIAGSEICDEDRRILYASLDKIAASVQRIGREGFPREH